MDSQISIDAPRFGATPPVAHPGPLMGSPGTLPPVIGRYVVKARLGSSQTAPVYEAWDPGSARPVAVVTVPLQPLRSASGPPTEPGNSPTRGPTPASTEGPDLDRQQQDALQQARAAVGLVHPHIATVLDAGWCAQGLYAVTQRLTGRDMRTALAQGWRPRASAAAQIMSRVAEALAHAHAAGVLHGDIRPAQIFLNEQDQPKLLGFGTGLLARSQGLRQGQVPLDSLHYLAPAQLQGAAADVQADIRAVGVVLYELLTQSRAFHGATAQAVTQAVLKNKLQPVRALQKNVSSTLAAIAMRAMANESAQGFAHAADLAQALAQWLDKNAARKLRAADAQSNKRQRKRAAHRSHAVAWFAGSVVATVAGMALLWQLSPTLRARLSPVDAATAAPAWAPGGAFTAPEAASSAVARPVPEQAASDGPVAQVAQVAQVVGAASAASAAGVSAGALSAPVAATAVAAGDVASDAARGALGRVAAPAPAAAATAADLRDAAYAAKRVGQVVLDVSPAAQVLVNGVLAGTAPPMTQLALPVGQQTITLRSPGFDPYSITVYVRHDQAVELRHLFTR